MDLKSFFRWEEATRDTIDVKKVYVDMADDLIAGVLLSQIVFWFLPNKSGKTKLRVRKEGHYWLVKGREDWWEECRIKPRQFDTAIAKLEKTKLVIKKVFKFQGETKLHIRINWEHFLPTLQEKINSVNYDGEVDNEYEDSIQADYLRSDSIEREHDEIVNNESGIYKSVNPDSHPKNLDNTGIHNSVIPELHSETIETDRINENVNPELQIRNSGITDLVNPFTETLTESLIDEEDINKHTRAYNTSYQILQEYLENKGLGKETIDRVILELIKRNVDSFTFQQIEEQYYHMMDKQYYGDRIYDFAVYFANGLKNLVEQARTKYLYREERRLYSQQEQTIQDGFPFYNWLEGKPTSS